MVEVFEVASDLMPSAGFGVRHDQGKSPGFEVARLDCAKRRAGGDRRPFMASRDRVVNQPRRRWFAPDQREVGLAGFSGGQLHLEQARSLRGLGKDDDAAGAAVEPVDGVDSAGPEVDANLVYQGGTGHAAGWVHGETRRFGDGQEGLVAV